MARIIIDARESGTSTGRYIDKLIEHLAKLKPDEQFTILTKPHRLEYIAKIALSFTVIEAPHAEFTFDEQIGFKKQLDGLKADLVHFGMTQQPVLYKGLVVTTIHDLTTMRFTNPDKNPVVYRLRQQLYKFVIKRAAKKSKQIITPSQYVKDDVVDFTGVSPDKITVTNEAGEAIADAPEPIKNLAAKQFLMYVGRPTPHKNLERLIDAFGLLQTQHPDLLLVLAGKKDSNYARIEENVNAKGLKNIVFTDFVSEGQLRWLYENCAAYIVPSLSEGFGLPGLEAMANSAPVISSNATCLPEIYGEGAHYFDPTDIDDIAKAVNEVITDEALRQKLIMAGKAKAATYSWQRTAEQTLEVYRKALTK